jgi:predicted Zn-dependent protease
MWWDVGKSFRSSEPIARLGNVFVYQGTFERPNAVLARNIFYRTIYSKIYTSAPDLPAAIKGIEESLALDDSCFFVSLELGNAYLQVRDRDGALRAYRKSLERAPVSDTLYDLIAEQVRRVETDPLENIALVRNPGIE